MPLPDLLTLRLTRDAARDCRGAGIGPRALCEAVANGSCRARGARRLFVKGSLAVVARRSGAAWVILGAHKAPGRQKNHPNGILESHRTQMSASKET